jgi:predicted type IV restriction endonuclease
MIDIRKPLKKFLPHLLAARDENLNESGTVQRLVKLFEDVLGYDPMSEITRELEIKEKYVDMALKLDGRVRLLLEAKAAGMALRDRHIEQAERYAAEGNIPWVILTNGLHWILYHLTFDEGIEYERVFSADLANDPFDQAAEHLALLHKKAVQKGEHEKFWEKRSALSPESISKALFTEGALRLIRREIRRREGIVIDQEDLATAIHACFTPEIRERMGPPKQPQSPARPLPLQHSGQRL